MDATSAVDAIDSVAIDSVDCCFSEMDLEGATIVGCCPPPTRLFAVCVEGGLDFSLTIEAQDLSE